MKTLTSIALIFAVGAGSLSAQSLPTDEAGAIAYLMAKKLRITKNRQGHAVKLFSSGKPAMTPNEY